MRKIISHLHLYILNSKFIDTGTARVNMTSNTNPTEYVNDSREF